MGSARCRFKRLGRVENKLEIKLTCDNGMRCVDVNIRTIFSESCFFGNAANVDLRRSMLNGESADVPENIVVASSLRYPWFAMATGTPRKPFSVWTILLCRT